MTFDVFTNYPFFKRHTIPAMEKFGGRAVDSDLRWSPLFERQALAKNHHSPQENGALRAALRVKPPHRNAHLAGLVGKVLTDAGAGENDHADGQNIQHLIVALEGRGVLVAGPVWLEHHLHDLAIVGPAGGDAFGTFRTTAMQQHHVGMLGLDLVEGVPDAGMVVAVEATGEGDAGADRDQHLGLGLLAGGDKIPAVDDCCGESSVVDH